VCQEAIQALKAKQVGLTAGEIIRAFNLEEQLRYDRENDSFHQT